ARRRLGRSGPLVSKRNEREPRVEDGEDGTARDAQLEDGEGRGGKPERLQRRRQERAKPGEQARAARERNCVGLGGAARRRRPRWRRARGRPRQARPPGRAGLLLRLPLGGLATGGLATRTLLRGLPLSNWHRLVPSARSGSVVRRARIHSRRTIESAILRVKESTGRESSILSSEIDFTNGEP